MSVFTETTSYNDLSCVRAHDGERRARANHGHPTPSYAVLDNPFKDGGPMRVDFAKDFSQIQQTLSPPKLSLPDWGEIPGMGIGTSGAGGGMFGGAPAWQSLTPGAADRTAQKTTKKASA